MLPTLTLEVLENIFKYLHYKDLNALCLTCKYLYKMTLQQLRSRWKDRKLFISQLQTGPIEQKLKMPRLALLKAIHVGSPTDPIMQYGSNNYSHEGLQKLLGVLRKFKNITELFLTNVKVNHLPTLQLAKIVKNLDTLDLTYTDITLQQLRPLLRNMSKKTTMDYINLTGAKLKSIPEKELAMGLQKVSYVQLSFSNILPQQLSRVLDYRDGKNRIRTLIFQQPPLSFIPDWEFWTGPVLWNSIQNLHGLSILERWGPPYWTGHLEVICRAVESSRSITQLQISQDSHINLLFNDMEITDFQRPLPLTLSPQQFAQCLSKLTSLTLEGLFIPITPEQYSCLLEKIASKQSNLETLEIESTDLSSIDEKILAGALTRLKTCSLAYTSLTIRQCIHIFQTLQELKTAMITGIDLSGLRHINSVDKFVFAKVCGRLKWVNLQNMNLSTDHWTEYMKQIVSQKQVVTTSAGWENNPSLSGVCPNLLRNAILKLEHVNLAYCRIPTLRSLDIVKGCLEGKVTRLINLIEDECYHSDYQERISKLIQDYQNRGGKLITRIFY